MTDPISQRLGTVTLEPGGAVIAGQVGQWRLVYTVGSYGVDEGGTIKLSQRFASDWQVPQFDRPQEPGYTTVSTTGAASLRPYYSTKAHERPWMKCLVIDVYDGYLAPGDQVTITLGDQSQGSPGIRAQTFQESAHEFRLLVDPTNACVSQPLPTSPRFPILPGEPAALVCVLPTQAVVGRPVEVFCRGADRWGNPTPLPEPLQLCWQGSGEVSIEHCWLTFLRPGRGRLSVKVSGLTGYSNPITAYAKAPAQRRFWGDLHAQSDATVGTGTEDEYFVFARDQARLDFVGHQGNDFQVSDHDWDRLNQAVRRYHQDGAFVVLPGYEWSGNTPAGGDHNIIYRHEGFPILRSSHWQIPGTAEDELSPAHPADQLFQRLRQQVGPENVLVMAHVGGRYADIRRYYDPALCHLVEIASCWGVFEWLLWDAFDMDCIVGVSCNSDGHKGRPGAEGPGAGEFGIASGLTCVLAPELTREALFHALCERRCYGTTGPRIDLSFELGGRPMGTVMSWREKARVRASVVGTAALQSLGLYRGRDMIQEVRPAAFMSLGGSRRIRISWRGARIRGRGRRVSWDGTLSLRGAQILEAEPFGFDTPSDGITERTPAWLAFRSRTTGDVDGLDLWLDQTGQGTLALDTEVGSWTLKLEDLDHSGGRMVFDLGGVEMQVCFERYPEKLVDLALELDRVVEPPAGTLAPYWVKAIQSDGHIAWSSPIYVDGRYAPAPAGS